MQGMRPSASTPLRSPQGHDLLFTSNYLGHVLLTDLLLPLLRLPGMNSSSSSSEGGRGMGGGRILQVSSNAQSLPSGSDLDTAGGTRKPLAAQVLAYSGRQSQSQSQAKEQQGEEDGRLQAAYSLSKLAQVMHAVALQKELDADPSTDVKVSDC